MASTSSRFRRVVAYKLEDEKLTTAMIEAGVLALGSIVGSKEELARVVYETMRAARPKYSASDKVRFWQKVIKRKPDDCWSWAGSRRADGYGKFFSHGTVRNAHIASWEITNERRVPKGFVVCHSCDNPPCVNPNHLWIGTVSQNIADMWAKGRARPNGLDARGSRNSRSILVEADIPIVRQWIAEGISQTEVARRFGVTIQCINRIHRGVAWAHVCDNNAE